MFFIIIIALIILFKIFDRVTNGYLGSYHGGRGKGNGKRRRKRAVAAPPVAVPVVAVPVVAAAAPVVAAVPPVVAAPPPVPPLRVDIDELDQEDILIMSLDDTIQDVIESKSKPIQKHVHVLTPSAPMQEYASSDVVVSTMAGLVAQIKQLKNNKSGLSTYGIQRAAENMLIQLNMLNDSIYSGNVAQKADAKRYINEMQLLASN
jgi:hypothetical protein